MSNNENQEKDYKIYIPQLKKFILVSKEMYQEYYRPIWSHQKKMQKLGNCLCSKGNHWKCDGCCLDCPYHDRKTLSLDYELEILGDIHSYEGSNDKIDIFDKVLLDALFKRLNELCPEAIEIGLLKLNGFSERAIEEKLDIPRKTFKYRIDKAKKLLESEFGEEIKKYF